MNGVWHDPEVELVSIYCDQRKAGEAHPSLKEEEGVLLGDLAHLREQVTSFAPLTRHSWRKNVLARPRSQYVANLGI